MNFNDKWQCKIQMVLVNVTLITIYVCKNKPKKKAYYCIYFTNCIYNGGGGGDFLAPTVSCISANISLRAFTACDTPRDCKNGVYFFVGKQIDVKVTVEMCCCRSASDAASCIGVNLILFMCLL
jgi:hypothetical protein